VEKDQTVWIAQRKGRTKDGNDTTDISVLKMLSLSGGNNLLDALAELNIIPVSISYEWEPCDGMKVRELYHSDGQEYVKQEDEDLNSIIGGVVSNKGRIHLSIGKSISGFLETIDRDQRPKAQLEEITAEIDRRIQAGYKLWPGNFMAHELLETGTLNKKKYRADDIDKFYRRMHKAIEMTDGDKDKTTGYFLRLYANPVYNKK
jgi:hypothetical protein